MSLVSKLRLPYRDDKVFGFLFLIALIVPLAFNQINYEHFEVIKFGLLILFTGCAAVIFFKRQRDAGFWLRSDKFFLKALGFFFLWTLIVSLLALDKNYAFFGFYPRFTNGFLFFGVWLLLLLLLASLSKAKLWLLLKVLFFCAILVAIWGILQSLGLGYYGGLTTALFSRAAPSFLGNPNFSAMFISGLVPLGIYFLVQSEEFSKKLYFGLGLFLQISGIVVFSSRGALLALGVGLFASLILGLVFYKKIGLKFFISVLVALVVLLGLSGLFLSFLRPGSIVQTVRLQETNVISRLGVWRLSLDAVLEKPIFGYGLGNFELAFESLRELSTIRTGFFDDPHNLYLHLAVNGGVILLLTFLLLVLYPCLLILKKIPRELDPANIAILGGILAWLTAAFFTPVSIPCFVLLAFLLSAAFEESHEISFKNWSSFRSLGLLTASGLLVYALCFITAEHLFYFSAKNYNAQNFSRSRILAKSASFLNPASSFYYQYLIGSSIHEGRPVSEIERLQKKFTAFHPKRAYTHVQLAKLNYLLLYKTQNPNLKETILQNLQTAINLDPHFADNYFSLAQYKFALGDLHGALSALNFGLDLHPANLEAWIFSAKIHQYLGEREQMIQALEKALQITEDKSKINNLIKLTKAAKDISKVPFTVRLNVGALD